MKQFILISSLLLITIISYSQPGTIDNSFGEKGIIRTETNMTGFIIDGRASALQPDGKIVVGGHYLNVGIPELLRYLPNGSVDSSFGKNGIAAIEAIGGHVLCMAVQPDGNIAVAGRKDTKPYIFAARFTPEGTLDNSFGNEGVIDVGFSIVEGVNDIALQSDGKLLLTGGASDDPEAIYYEYSTVIRLNPDGTVDKSFAGDGRAENDAANENVSLALQPADGKIVTAGFQYLGSNESTDYVVSRYNADGTPDKTFGNKGNTMTDAFGFEDNPESIVIQPDGNIILGGFSAGTGNGFPMTALRYTSKGVLDNSFGKEGKVTVSFEGKNAKAYQVLLQPDGKIILSGGVYSTDPKNYADIALCRLNENGSVDSSFAINGRQVTVIEPGGETSQSAMLQPDGKIVLVGYSEDTEGYNLAVLLIRYNGDKGQKSLIARIKNFLHNHGINWQGLDNKDIRYYSVQYSKTGSGFAERGKVSGGGSNAFQQYNFTVNDAGYYRIVAVDNKGYKTFSNKVMVSAADIASSASVYPNPAKDYVTVNGLQPNEPASISISNGSGAVLAKGTNNGGTQYRATTSNMQPGTYYINITTKGKTEALTFVKE